MFVLGVIPARAGSKGIPSKNTYPLCGIPMIQYTLDAAKGSKMLSDCVISTDKSEMVLGYKRICRPAELAQDDTPMLPVIQHAVAVYEMAHMGVHVDAVMTLQPTSPLRLTEDIDGAIQVFVEKNKEFNRAPAWGSLVSVCHGIHPTKSYLPNGDEFIEKAYKNPYDKHKHKCFTRNGAIFITRRDFLEEGSLWGICPILYLMPKSRSIDIDDYEDLLIVESILKTRGELN